MLFTCNYVHVEIVGENGTKMKFRIHLTFYNKIKDSHTLNIFFLKHFQVILRIFEVAIPTLEISIDNFVYFRVTVRFLDDKDVEI